jgi:hypothetical protein
VVSGISFSEKMFKYPAVLMVVLKNPDLIEFSLLKA